MSLSWAFNPIVSIILISFLILLATLDLRYQGKTGRITRLVGLAIALLSLYGLWNQPTLRQKAPESNILIYSSDTFKPDLTMSDSSLVFENFSAWLKVQKLYNSKSLTIVGSGLEDWQIASIHQPFQFIAKPLSEGIIDLQHSTAYAKTPFTLEGLLHLEENTAVFISPPSGKIEQLAIDTAGRFLAKLTISLPGNYTLNVFGIRQEDTLFQEKYPILVAEKPGINVLFLTGFPSFETRYLKNHLLELGYQVSSKQQTGQDLFITENTTSRPKNSSINQQMLERQQLLIFDKAGFEQLSSPLQKKAVENLRQGQTGWLLLDEVSMPSLRDLKLSYRSISQKQLKWQFDKDEVELTSRESMLKGQGLIHRKRIIANSSAAGLGYISQMQPINTYLLVLNNAQAEYNSAWQTVLSKTMGSVTSEKNTTFNAFATVGRKADGIVFHENLSSITINGEIATYQQLPFLDHTYQVDFWPDQSGWTSLQLNNEEPIYAFINEKGRWQTHFEELNQHRTKEAEILNTHLKSPTFYVTKQVSKWIFFTLFLLSSGLLWLIHRLR
ncbi:MAG: hypothetical protein ACI8QD_000900 [Cyclobacteriaceae bacterium]|jgi:hypothetical protein